MQDPQPPRALSRRNFLTGLTSAALSFTALGAFAQGTKKAWGTENEVAIEVEINQPEGVSRYRRPYVVVWIEDKNGNPVRSLSLWVQRTPRGPRWIPSLKRWYRLHKGKSVAGNDYIETLSSATRQPGRHTLIWDGKDEDGKLVGPSDYAICIEAAREHGTYQFIRKAYRIGHQPFSDSIPGNTEIKSARVEYRKRR